MAAHSFLPLLVVFLLVSTLLSISLAAPQQQRQQEPDQRESSSSSQQQQQQPAGDSTYFDGVRQYLKDVQERRPDMYANDPEVTRLRQELQKHDQSGGSSSSGGEASSSSQQQQQRDGNLGGGVNYQPIESSGRGTGVSRTSYPGAEVDIRRRGQEPRDGEDRDVDQDEKDLRQMQLEQQRLIEQQQRQQHEQQLLERQQQQQQQEEGGNREGRLREYYQDISGYLEDVKRTRSDLFDIDPDVQRLRNELKQYESTNGKVTPNASSSSASSSSEQQLQQQPQRQQPQSQPSATDGSSRTGGARTSYEQQQQPQQQPSSPFGYGARSSSSAPSSGANSNIADPFAHDVNSGSASSIYATVDGRRPDDSSGYQQQVRGSSSSSNYPTYVPNAYARNSANTPQAYGGNEQQQQRRAAPVEGQQIVKDDEEDEEANDPRSSSGEYDPYAQYASGPQSSHTRLLHEQALRTRQAAEQHHEDLRRAQQEQDQQQYQDWRRRFFSRRQCTPEQLRQQHQQWLVLHQQSGMSSVPNDLAS